MYKQAKDDLKFGILEAEAESPEIGISREPVHKELTSPSDNANG